MAILCNFSRKEFSEKDPKSSLLLTHHEAETLFHEFGHACHNLLSRTHFQHTAGDRSIYIYIYIYNNLYIYREREIERERDKYRERENLNRVSKLFTTFFFSFFFLSF